MKSVLITFPLREVCWKFIKFFEYTPDPFGVPLETKWIKPYLSKKSLSSIAENKDFADLAIFADDFSHLFVEHVPAIMVMVLEMVKDLESTQSVEQAHLLECGLCWVIFNNYVSKRGVKITMEELDEVVSSFLLFLEEHAQRI
jgi:hypothetical protein